MKKFKLFLFAAVLLSGVGLHAGNTITYTATEQLPGYSSSLNVGKTTFGPAITSHTFSNGTGTITCAGEITTIGAEAFRNCSSLTAITIPTSVTTIGKYAFQGCNELTSIEIPHSVTSIGRGVFYNCYKLTSVEIPNSVTIIEDYFFSGCSGLTSVELPYSVTTIGEKAFAQCQALTSITIPTSVTTIGTSAFYSCSRLNSITIPNSVTTIGDYAFDHCYGLTSVAVSWTNEKSMPSMGAYVFSMIADEVGPAGAMLLVPEGTKRLYQHADVWKEFGYIIEVGNITSFTYTATAKLPGYNGSLQLGATTFGPAIIGHEFSGNTGVITCANEITTIGNYAFYDCTGLTSITIPNSVTTIGEWAFYNCKGLTSITIPNSVTTTGEYAFACCSGLTSIIIPNSVTSIGEQAFGYCSGLTSVTIPNSVTRIGDEAFYYCSGLTSVTVFWTDEKSIPSINSNVFGEIAHNKGPEEAKLCVPKGTEELYQQADEWNKFGGMESDIIKINNLWYRPLNVRTANVITNQDTTATGERIPYTGDIIINKTAVLYDIAAIEDSAFYNAKLTSLTVLTDIPLPCSEHTFTGQDKSIPLYVLDVPAFQSAKYWKEFTNILFYQPYKEEAKKKVQDIVNGIPSQYASLAKPIADNYFQDIENVNTIRQVDDLTARTLKKLQVFYDQGLWIKSGDYWLLKGKELLK